MIIRLTALALVIAVVSASAASAQNAKNGESKLIVQVGVFNLKPDGTPGGYAIQSGEAEGDSFGGVVVVIGCGGVGAGDSWSGSDSARDVWESKGRVVSLSDAHAVVQVEWRRVRTAGIASSSPVQTQTLTLAVDQLQTLELASPAPADCSDRAVVFGARYAMFSPTPKKLPNAVTASGPSQTAGVQPFSAELWLVRHVPGRPDDVKATTVRLTDTGAFDFGRQQFSTGGGVLDVRVEGRLRIVGGQKMLTFEATRAATFTPASQSQPPRDRDAPQPEGRASVSRVLPGPDEVIEFEMPPLELSRAPKLPDTFAVRLRIRPVK